MLDHGYQVAKEQLRARQHGKCAYCETQDDAFKRPVEHFRPKRGAENQVGARWVWVDTHYWWLAWTWTNLYFSCDLCNRTGNKGNRFPIVPGQSRAPAPTQPASDPLPASLFDVTAEPRVLVDPRRDQPLDHLQWTPRDQRLPKARWTWTLEGRDQRGRVTIEAIGLTERIDRVNLHLKPLQLLWIQIEGHLQAGRAADAAAAWSAAVTVFVEDPKQPYRNAAWWALDWYCPAADQNNFGFRAPPIPAVTYPP